MTETLNLALQPHLSGHKSGHRVRIPALVFRNTRIRTKTRTLPSFKFHSPTLELPWLGVALSEVGSPFSHSRIRAFSPLTH
jgi:hypothetical protein